MSLIDAPCRNDYIGNNSASVYSFTFQIVNLTDLLVVKRTDLGVESELDINTDYSVDYSLHDLGGNITLIAGNLPTDFALMIRRKKPLDQETDIRNQGAYFPEVIEDTFDQEVMNDQQQQEEIDRSFKCAETETGFDATMPYGIIDNPGAVIVVNNAGDGLDFGPTVSQIAAASGSAAAAAASAAAAAASETVAVDAAVQATQSAADAADFAAMAQAAIANVTEVDTSGGDVAETLPLANVGKQFVSFINTDFGGPNKVNVSPPGGNTLMNGAGPDPLGAGEVGTYWSNGVTKWYRMN